LKLIYITSTRLPSEKANSYQSMQMCNSFSKIFDDVELWTGKARNTEELSKVDDVFDYYNIDKTFAIRYFFRFDFKILAAISEFIWANTGGLVFAINVCLHLIKYRKSLDVVVYTRVWHVLYVFALFKKIGAVDGKLYYEAHKFSGFLLKQLYKVNGLVVINNYLEKLYKNHSVMNCLVAHDGVTLDEYKNISRYQFHPKKKEYIIVYTGSLFTWKGVNTLVDSMKYLPKEIKLTCIGGGGQYLIDFKEYVEYSTEHSRITIVPHVPKVQLIEFIEQADVLVLPNSSKDKMSLYTSPIKMFEYMASKRPIVASNLSSIREVLRDMDNAILCEPDAPEDLARKIQYVVNNDCDMIVKRAVTDVKEYTWDNRAINIKKFIESDSVS